MKAMMTTFRFARLRALARLRPDVFGVTVVLTSCNRYELLGTTLSSFFQYNAFPIRKIIIVEDGPGVPDAVRGKFRSKPIEWLTTGQRVGQIAAIDYAYSRVKTPYIFHLEDDWQFFNRCFIEKSMHILRQDPNCLQVWLRALDDTNGHPVEPEVFAEHGVRWRKLSLNYRDGNWNGFSLNPGLRRLADYIKTGGFGRLARFNFQDPWNSEIRIGKFFRDKGYYAVILCDQDGKGYVRHTGDDHHILPPASGPEGVER
jgi:hypothetical protein